MKLFVCLSATVAGGKNIDNIGRYIGENEHTLVYGGGERGAMGQLSSYLAQHYPSVLQMVYTIPAYAFDIPSHSSCIEVCENLLARLAAMIRAADAAIVCPGGLGTAQELLTLIEWSKTEQKLPLPIVIINENGHYDWLIKLVDTWIEEGYADSNIKGYFKIVDNFNDATTYLDNI